MHKFQNLKFSGDGYHLPTNHPYYKVREHNAMHGTNLVLHDGSAKAPEDWDEDGRCLYRDGGVLWIDTGPEDWMEIIAYTPKPKESEVTEEFPSDEAIEYVRQNFGWHEVSVDEIKRLPDVYKTPVTLARLIQQYEPDRLKSAVDVAAEEYAEAEGFDVSYEQRGFNMTFDAFKAGAAWQKENGNG